MEARKKKKYTSKHKNVILVQKSCTINGKLQKCISAAYMTLKSIYELIKQR